MGKYFSFILVCLASTAFAEPGYFRYPSLHNDTVVFTAEGDLWIATIGQPAAARLTSSPTEETQSAISPDGKQLAFVADYEGSDEVYVMPIDGGIPKRVSFENSTIQLSGWTPDGRILYSTDNHIGPARTRVMRTVNINTLYTRTIPLMDAIEGVIDKNGDNIFFVQRGLQLTTDNVKVYRGGATGELWRFRLDEDDEAVNLTQSHIGSIRNPMLSENTLYFISDESGNDNIWSMSITGDNLKQITHHRDFSVRKASYHNGKIIYQIGADLEIIDLSSNQADVLSFKPRSDFSNLRERWINEPIDYLTNTSFGSAGKKVAITARGNVAIAGTNNQRLVEIAAPNSARLRSAVSSNDGKWVYAISDEAGEPEIWRYPADGSLQSQRLTNDGSVFRWNIHISPDGKWLAHDDKAGNLWLLNTDSLENKIILDGHVGIDPYPGVEWSSNSRYLAVTRVHEADERARIILMDVENGQQQTITNDKYNAHSPAFSLDGSWLYFLSEREFNAAPRSPWGDRNMGVNFDQRTLIFAYALVEDAQFPFQKPNELTSLDEEPEEGGSENDSVTEEADTTVSINWSGLTERLWQVPVSADNFSNLAINKSFIYVQQRDSAPNAKTRLKALELKPFSELKVFSEDVAQFDLSADRKKIFVRKSENNAMFIVDANGAFPSDTKNAKVSTQAWKLKINPQQEWQQLFHDAWLQHRDSLFDPSMREVNWDSIKEKYQPLLERITDRWELNDVLAQMIAEVNTLHSQIRGGEYPEDKARPNAASLGAQLVQTGSGVTINKIYQHDIDFPLQASPLNQPGVDAENGDLISAINGVDVTTIAELHKALNNQVGKQVLLSLTRGEAEIETVVVPINANRDFNLRYSDWVVKNQGLVNSANAKLGYFHLSAMTGSDISTFAKEFYAHYNKDGLIIDVRRNRGGNIDSLLLEKLLRQAWMFWQPTAGPAFTNMQNVFRGHLVVLVDEYTYSDGETFTAGVKALELGTVIGKQTTGAGVWLSDRNRLSDSGIARVAEYPVFSMDGRWLVEGRGVKPDIEVDNLPHATFQGQDAQLSRAIQFLEEQIKQNPIPALEANPFPARDGLGDDIN